MWRVTMIMYCLQLIFDQVNRADQGSSSYWKIQKKNTQESVETGKKIIRII